MQANFPGEQFLRTIHKFILSLPSAETIINVIPNSVSMHARHCCNWFGHKKSSFMFFFDILATAALSYLKLLMLPSNQRN